MMDSINYGFYEIKMVGSDETEIIVGSSLEAVQAEMQSMFGDGLDSVKEVAGYDLISQDPLDPEVNHTRNISILTGRNPFAESFDELADITKKISHPGGTGKEQFADQKAKLRKELDDLKAKRMTKEEMEQMNEISMGKLKDYHDKALDHSIDKGMGKTEPNPKNPKLNRYVPASAKDKATSLKRATGAGLAKRKMDKKRAAGIKEEAEVAEAKKDKSEMPKQRDAGARAMIDIRKSGAAGAHINKAKRDSDPRKAKHKGKMYEEDDIVTEDLLNEGEDKLAYLIRIGLMSRNELQLVRRAMALRKSNAPMSKKHRDIIFKLLDKMLAMVIKNPHMYNLAKRKIMSEAIDDMFEDLQDHELVESYIEKVDMLEKRGLWDNIHAKRKRIKNGSGEKMRKPGSKGAPSSADLKNSQSEEVEEVEEAGYMDQPTTKAEVKKKFPDTETDVKYKNTPNLQTLNYK